MGAAFVLMLVELLLDLSLLWILELLLNHWRFFYQRESLFANCHKVLKSEKKKHFYLRLNLVYYVLVSKRQKLYTSNFDIKQINKNQAIKSWCVLYKQNRKRVTKGYIKKLITNKRGCS